MTKTVLKGGGLPMMNEHKEKLKAALDAIRQQEFLSAYSKAFSLFRADTDAWKEHVFRLRYDVYCDENLFINPDSHPDKFETDSYDDRAEHYILLHRATAKVVGTLRLVLPNDEQPSQSFSVQEVCDHRLLKQDSRLLTIAEISRFCMAKSFRKRELDGCLLPAYYDQDMIETKKNGRVQMIRRRIPYAPLGLLAGAFESALNARITDCVWMVEPRQLWSLKKIGLNYRVLGPHIDHHGGLQPVIFNIKNVLDSMHRQRPHCWDIVSDEGRLQKMADDLAQNDWQDSLIDDTAGDLNEDRAVF